MSYCLCNCPRCFPAGYHDCSKPACLDPAGLNDSERDRLVIIRKASLPPPSVMSCPCAHGYYLYCYPCPYDICPAHWPYASAQWQAALSWWHVFTSLPETRAWWQS